MKKQCGFTLIDLLIAIATSGILLGFAIPNLAQMIAEKSSDVHAYSIWRMLAKTRDQAVSSGLRTTFCGVDEKDHCVRDDIKAFMIFHDTNGDQKLNDDETPIQRIDLNHPGTINLRASNQKRITFSSEGYALQFGSIVLCHANKNSQYIRRVTVNRSGRSYVAKTKTNESVIKSATGEEIECK